MIGDERGLPLSTDSAAAAAMFAPAANRARRLCRRRAVARVKPPLGAT